MRTPSSLLALLLLLLCCTTFLSHLATAQEFPGRAGGWKRIRKDADYDHVLGIAETAVWEHNRQTGQDLKFVRIIRGDVDGRYYRLIIHAIDHGRKHRYEAVVWEKLYVKLRELISFKLLA